MREEKNIKNNLTYYMVSSSNAACALSVVVETMQQAASKELYEKCISALNFLSDEIYTRSMAVDDFLEDGELSNFISKKDIYAILAERKRERANKED
ncbi:hypothetical protein CDJ04_06420 [Salmonella enterica]|uniref:hypothetical protein n=1 Tax=Salmonella enterica TaxID=28901 RepID=UPI0012C49BFE|nr:hypothetical protein [Salmonella enterica]EBZ5139775.1 hypothetical protein [Salmonella enterica subsp. enterica serovar Antsalova]EHI8599444.1 hypothetical protein [Salmonella enterica subsp. enterica serovar 51:z:1,5]EAW9081713.1 hypothetical protein [Salmonella enterica]ECS6898300.1 hypothetical protein [Salmonella enterica]